MRFFFFQEADSDWVDFEEWLMIGRPRWEMMTSEGKQNWSKDTGGLSWEVGVS